METVLPGVIVDGAHNEDGVEKFVETAEHFQKECPLTLLFSAVDDKDYTDMIHTICSRITFRQVVVTSVGGYRQVPAERFAKLFTEAGASSVPLHNLSFLISPDHIFNLTDKIQGTHAEEHSVIPLYFQCSTKGFLNIPQSHQ